MKTPIKPPPLLQVTDTKSTATPAEETVPSQVAQPKQAVLRTLTALLGGLIAAPVILLTLVSILQIIGGTFSEWLSEEVKGSLVAFSAILVASATALTRIMAIPAVNSWLEKLGLGAEKQEQTEKEDENDIFTAN